MLEGGATGRRANLRAGWCGSFEKGIGLMLCTGTRGHGDVEGWGEGLPDNRRLTNLRSPRNMLRYLGCVTKQTLQQVADAIVVADPGSESGAGSACLPQLSGCARGKGRTHRSAPTGECQRSFVAGPNGPSSNLACRLRKAPRGADGRRKTGPTAAGQGSRGDACVALLIARMKYLSVARVIL